MKKTHRSKILLGAALAMFLLGCSKSAPRDDDATQEPSGSDARVQEIMEAEDTAPEEEPWQLTTVAEVIEVMDSAVKVKTRDEPHGVVIPVSDDVVVYDGATRHGLARLKPGDQVELLGEQRGDPEEGWHSLVVQINLDPSSGSATSSQPSPAEPAGKDGDGGDVEDADPEKFERSFQGEVVEISDETVTIRDPEESKQGPSTFPVERPVRVAKGGELGDLTLLSVGDRVTMVGQSEGNPQDGYFPVIRRIEVHAEEAENGNKDTPQDNHRKE